MMWSLRLPVTGLLPGRTPGGDAIGDRVLKGALLLDERMPGWASQIDVDALRMDSASDCVLGQLARESGVRYTDRYTQALRDLSGENSYHMAVGWAVAHGFDLNVAIPDHDVEVDGDRDWDPTFNEWVSLADAWRSEIAFRTPERVPAP